MRLDKFTVKAQDAISAAQRIAEESGHQMLENYSNPPRPPSGEGRHRGSDPGEVGRNAGRSQERHREGAVKAAQGRGGGPGTYMGPALKKSIDIASAEAERLKDDYVSTEHLLIGIADANEGGAFRCSGPTASPKTVSTRSLRI